MTAVPFDLERWTQVAAEKYPNGLPKPYSDDPTQWLFHGHPKPSSAPLQVALARLLGYSWPAESDAQMELADEARAWIAESAKLRSHIDNDGIVCLSALNREAPAAERLRALLRDAFGSEWSAAKERELLAACGSKKSHLEDWLRDEFFEQHLKLFHDRPFLWHIWDGRKDGDGFHALVNYHQLDHANLNKLTESYLGDWLRIQKQGIADGIGGAEARFAAAQALQQKLQAILKGEAPLDIFVRWKPLKEQALGWTPDLNDGVRLNIRPFLFCGDVGKKGAGILRVAPKSIKWDKDRGTDPTRPALDFPWSWCADEPGSDPTPQLKEWGPGCGNRWNAVHLSLAQKLGARASRPLV